MTTNPEPKPTELYLKGGSTGVLLIHGFTGSSTEMSLVGDYLHQRGLTILAPLVPGHGTSPEDLNRKRWTDWVGHTEQALERMHAECSTVFVGGLSLGALLSLYAAGRDDRIDGVIAYSPPIVMAHPRTYLMPLKYLLSTVPKPKDFLDDPEAKAQLWNYSVAPLRAYYELQRTESS